MNPVRSVPVILQALADLEDGARRRHRRPGVRRGRQARTTSTQARSWPATGPPASRRGPALGVRVGYPRRLDRRSEAFGRLRAAVLRAAAADPWLAGHPPAAAPDRLPRRGLPAPARPPAGDRGRGRARKRARRPARAAGARQHHRRPLLPQPVRPARPGLRPARPATSTPPTRRSSWPASSRGARTLARFIARYFAAAACQATPEAISLDAPQAMLATPGLPDAADSGTAVSEASDSAASPAAPDAATSAAAAAGTPPAIDPFGHAAHPDHAADRGRADRRAVRHRDRARRVRARPAAAVRARAGRACSRSAGPRCARRCSGCRRPATSPPGAAAAAARSSGPARARRSDEMIRRTLRAGLGTS